MRFGRTTIVDKVLFGTGAFLINRPYAELCDEVRELPVQRDVLEAWLHGNAARVLGLDALGTRPDEWAAFGPHPEERTSPTRPRGPGKTRLVGHRGLKNPLRHQW